MVLFVSDIFSSKGLSKFTDSFDDLVTFIVSLKFRKTMILSIL